MKITICCIGLHDWKITHEETYRSIEDKRIALTEQNARRVCRKCGKTQERDVHCLGLNPPKYVRTWLDVNE